MTGHALCITMHKTILRNVYQRGKRMYGAYVNIIVIRVEYLSLSFIVDGVCHGGYGFLEVCF
jgi:hypothetical protein